MADQTLRAAASRKNPELTLSPKETRCGGKSPVAALYIDELGEYARMGLDQSDPDPLNWSARVDCWGVTRDARLYDGPGPVVAHPPCGPWGKQRHNYRGSEHDCAPRAVKQVRAFGGVLEHPAGSLLWKACGLPRPDSHEDFAHEHRNVDHYVGYTIEVCQVEWGHPARKPTWLYLVGVPRSALEPPPFPGRQPTHWCSGNRNNKNGGSVPPGIKICSAQQRRRTPPLFAEYLIRLAQSARKDCP